MTIAQRSLMMKHGTPRQFEAACARALGEISYAEFHSAVQKYQAEWDDAGRKTLAEARKKARAYVQSPAGKRDIARATKKVRKVISQLKRKAHEAHGACAVAVQPCDCGD